MSIMKKYRLQLLSHGEIFNNREDAVRYINEHFKRYALWAEPAVVYYENSDGELRMIVAVGATQDPDHKRIYMMDDGEVREIVENAAGVVEDFATTVSTISADLQSAIEAAGLTLDPNNINNRVEYQPNIEDNVIKDATSLAEAIEKVSEYAQNITQYTADNDAHSVAVSIDGSKISADVKISNSPKNALYARDGEYLFVGKEQGSETESAFTEVVEDANGGRTISTLVKLSEDNSIRIKDGGLSAKVDLDVNERSNTITFTIGDTEKVFALPGINVIDKIEYDSENNDIVIYYYTGSDSTETVSIPLRNIFDIDDFTAEIDEERRQREETDAVLWQKIAETNNTVTDLSGDVSADITDLQDKVEAAITGAGLNSDGSYTADTLTNYIGVATSLNEADRILDSALARQTTELGNQLNEVYHSLNGRIDSVAGTTTNAINGIDSRLSDAEATLSNGIELRKVDNNNPRLYGLFVNGVEKGRVEIPEDQDKFLSSVTYDEANHTLIFIWNDDAQTETPVPIENLFNVYTAGNGIDINNNVISVKLSETTEGFLKIENNTLTLDGVQDAIDSAVESTSMTLGSEISELQDSVDDLETKAAEIDNKANSSDVYTKSEVDSKLDDKSDTLFVENTDTVSMSVSNENVITSNVKIDSNNNNAIKTSENGLYVKIDSNNNNIIKVSENGLYSNVRLGYNSALNKLTFYVNDNETEIPLVGGTFVKDARYNPENQTISFTITVGGNDQTLDIPLQGFIDTYGVKNTHKDNNDTEVNNNVILSLDENNKFSAQAVITNSQSNALVDQNSGLYVSNNANDYVASYKDETVTVQEAIRRLIAKDEQFNDDIFGSDPNSLVSQYNTIIADLTGRLTDAERKIRELENLIATITGGDEHGSLVDYENRISRLETMVGDYNDYQGDNDPSNDGWSI